MLESQKTIPLRVTDHAPELDSSRQRADFSPES